MVKQVVMFFLENPGFWLGILYILFLETGPKTN